MNEASSISPEFRFRGSAADLMTWGQLQQTTGGCMFCPEWTVTGTAIEVRELCVAHRLEEHPEIKPGKRRRGKGIPMRWRSALSDEHSAEIADERSKRMRLLGIKETEAAP